MQRNFSGKCHALLCREYVKGRDWFDLSWYISKKVTINFDFLSSAINQNGPWKDHSLKITKSWLVNQLIQKINAIDWSKAKLEVTRFLSPQYQKNLALWSKEFFIDKIQKLEGYL